MPKEQKTQSQDPILASLEMIAKELRNVKDSVAQVSDTVGLLTNRVSTLEESKESKPLDEIAKASQPSENNDIIKAVNEILGDRFTHVVHQATPGLTFRLEVIPPEQLAEYQGASNSQVISVTDGVEGVKVYLRRVRDFYIALCAKRGLQFDQYARSH